MKFLRFSFLFLSAVVFTSTLKAQDFDDADLSFLSGQTKFNVEYNYDKMMVVDDTEETYKKEKMAKFDAKQPGKGDRWAEKWVNARALAYEPMFEELISKYVFKANG